MLAMAPIAWAQAAPPTDPAVGPAPAIPAAPAAADPPPPPAPAPPAPPAAAPPAAAPPADPYQLRREALFDIAFAALASGRLELAKQSFDAAAALPGDPVRASVAASFADR